ncbi:hypothetical protein BRY75_02890 [Acinetobacter baumannii]|uniref:hypothetical protein n=1 Tax=Acinetobacter baumannii TaxID=470 RepID=UPI000926A447|nr:hypothetical protein [Acinetobacter baumannii]OJK08872.1 hypothetical protein BRY75_02890 [Acinetobacter baumannii]
MVYVKDNLKNQHLINLDLVTNVIVTDLVDGSLKFSFHYAGHIATQLIVSDPEQQEDLMLSLIIHNQPSMEAATNSVEIWKKTKEAP